MKKAGGPIVIAIVLGLLTTARSTAALSVITNVAFSQAISQHGLQLVPADANYSGNNTFESLTNTTTSIFSNIVSTGSAAFGYVLVSPGSVTISGYLNLSASFPSNSDPSLQRVARAAGGVFFGLGFANASGMRYSVKYVANLPTDEVIAPSTLSNVTYVGTSPSAELSVAVDGLNVFSTNSSSGGAFIYTNDSLFVTNATLTIVPTFLTTLTVLHINTAATNLTRSGNFLLNVAVPYLDQTRNGSQFTLTWPTNYSNYILERATNVNGLGGWTTVSGGISTSNGLNVLTLPLSSSGNAFYRLRK